MKTLDDVKASVDTVMTPDLVRLFAFAGCEPAECHACGRKIAVGATFKLVPHPRSMCGDVEYNDEMCCAKCGTKELNARDRRVGRNDELRRKQKIAAGQSGFSRPSKEAGNG